jgi:hypothetical protein
LRAAVPLLLQHCKRQRCHRYDLGLSDFRRTICSNLAVLRPVVLRSYRPAVLRHLQQCTIFFKLYVVLEFCS